LVRTTYKRIGNLRSLIKKYIAVFAPRWIRKRLWTFFIWSWSAWKV